MAPISEALVRTQRILVADDSVAHRRIIRRHLEAAGHDVTTTGRVEEVLAVLHSPSEMVDVILVDLWIPGVDSFDLIQAMTEWSAALPGAQAAPRILGMSSFAPGTPEAAQEEEHALASGAEACLFKPVRPEDLAARLDPTAR